jgi:translation initiation factor 2 alpha subunit (eIF-2alpha)
MARTPNYSFERQERDRQKARKAAEKAAEKAAAKQQASDTPPPPTDDQ